MKTLFKISAMLFVLSANVFCLEWNSTGELLAAKKYLADWPPLLLTRPYLQHAFETDRFMIHYDTDGPNAVYNPDEDFNPADGVPDYINRMADYLELSYNVYLNELGFDRPPPDFGAGGNEKYDIYVTDIIGITVAEDPTDYYPGRPAYTAYSFIGHDLRTQHNPNDPLPFLKATCSHELFHAFQIAYRAFPSDNPYWWYELTANWAEERVFDDINEIYYYLPEYFLKVDRSIYLTGGSHMYGAWVLAEYLSEKYGDDIIKTIFSKLINYENSISAINAVLAEMNLNINDCFAEFTRWNYFTGNRWRHGYFEEGAYFPVSVPISITHTIYPTGVIETPKSVENLGCAYIEFIKPNQLKANLNVFFYADPIHPLYVALTAIYSNSTLERVFQIERNHRAIIRVNDFASTERVILSVFWPYEGMPLVDTASYYYVAEIDTIYSEIETQQNQPPIDFEITSVYPNPFNSRCLINFDWNRQERNYQIRFYDVCGRLIDRFDGVARYGNNTISWCPQSSVAGGVYFYSISIDGLQRTNKIMFLK